MRGGIITLELDTVYYALGSEIDVIEIFDQVIPIVDKEIVKLFTKQINKNFNLMHERKVIIWKLKDNIYVKIEEKKKPCKSRLINRCMY
ncbi:MAG: NAD-binding protein [Arsenophonus sp. NC-PE1-MAG3]